MTLQWSPLRPIDVPALAALVNAATEADEAGRPIPESAFAEDLSAPRFDPTTDTVAVWDGDRLVAAGSVSAISEPVDGRAMIRVVGHVHPEHRRRGIGRALLTRLETRAVELAQERLPGLPVRLRGSGGVPGSSTQRLLEAAGYVRDNSFVTMEISLSAWRDPGTMTDVLPLDDARQRAARDAHNDAFRDHRNASDVPEDVWEHWVSGSTNRQDLGRVVLDDDDRVLAYALVSEHQSGVAHIELVGTRREARGRGLGRAVLVGAVRAARDAGLDVAELEVDSTSPTRADRLYASVGFVAVRTITRYQRDIPRD